MMAFDYQEWAEVVPLTRMADAEAAFREWLRLNGLTPSDIDPNDIMKQVARVKGGSAVRYFVRRDVRDRLLKTAGTMEHPPDSCPEDPHAPSSGETPT